MSCEEKPLERSIRIRSGTPQGRYILQRCQSPLLMRHASSINLKNKVNPDFNKTLISQSILKKKSQPRFQLNSSMKLNSPEDTFLDSDVTSSDFQTPSTKSTAEKSVDLYALESKIKHQMRKFGEESRISAEKFRIFNKLWNKLIAIESPYARIMQQIKNGYDEWTISLETELKTKNKEISALTNKLKEETHTIKLLKKRFKKLAIENMEISSHLSDKNKENGFLDEKIKALKAQLKSERGKIMEIKEDNETVKELLKQSKDYTKELKKRIRVFRDLVTTLKLKGFPVEDIYKDMLKDKNSRRSNDSRLMSMDHTNSLIQLAPSIHDLEHLSSIDFLYSPSVEYSDIGEIFTYKESHEDSVFNSLDGIKDS